MATTKLLTADDLWQMTPEPGYRYELIRGELRRMAAAGARHGEIGFETGRRLGNYAAEHGLGRLYTSDTGFVLFRDPDIVVMPDVAFVRWDRLPPDEEREGYLSVSPDLVIEVVSRTDRPEAIDEKIALYLQAGVPLLWLIRPPERTATVYRPGASEVVLGEKDMLDGADVVPGFRLLIAEIFRQLLLAKAEREPLTGPSLRRCHRSQAAGFGKQRQRWRRRGDGLASRAGLGRHG